MSNARAERFAPWALAIFALALALRLLHLWQLRASPFLEVTLGDSAAYDAWARRLAAGDWLGSEVFYQAPLYPYFLGVLYATLGDAPLLVRGLQSVLGAAACALLASAGARLLSVDQSSIGTASTSSGLAPVNPEINLRASCGVLRIYSTALRMALTKALTVFGLASSHGAAPA